MKAFLIKIANHSDLLFPMFPNTYGKPLKFKNKTGFLNSGTTDILDQINLCCEGCLFTTGSLTTQPLPSTHQRPGTNPHPLTTKPMFLMLPNVPEGQNCPAASH